MQVVKSFRKYFALFLAVLVAVSLFIAVGDLTEAMRISLRLDRAWLALCVAASVVAYASFVQLHVRALGILGQPWSYSRAASAVIPSTALGYLANVGGVTGPTARAILFRTNGLEEGEVAGLFLMQTVASNAFYLLLLALGIAGAGMTGLFPGWAWPPMIGFIILVALLLLWLARLIATPAQQGRALARLDRLRLRLRPDSSAQPIADRWGPSLARLSGYAHRDPARFLSLFFWGGMDWFFATAVLHFGLEATGVHVPFFWTAAALGAGILVGTISMVPGGTGVMDGTGVGVYAAMGIPVENALIAMLLFRLIFFVIPFALSLIVYRKQFVAVRTWATKRAG